MGTYIIYALEVQADKVLAQARVNDAIVFDERDGRPRFTGTKLNPWIIEGANEIELLMAPPPGQDEVPSGASLKMLVIKGEHGKMPGPDANVVSYEWDGSEVAAGQLTSVHVAPIPVDEAHGRWAWQDATPIAPGDEAQVAALMDQAQQALQNRDANAFDALMTLKLDEIARALDTPAANLHGGLGQQLGALFAHPDWQADPVDPSRLVLTSTAGGRLVQVTDAGRAPLRGLGGGEVLALEATVSHLQSGWTIVR